MNNDTIEPCKFCGQEAEYKPLEEMKQYGVAVYFCYKCLTEYIYWINYN